MKDRVLDVYLNDKLVGKLTQGGHGNLSFTYELNFLDQAQVGISLSLPLREQPFEDDRVKAFFSGLLPDESVRQKLAQYLGVSEKNPFALLRAIGGECAGALSLYPEGQKPPNDTDDNVEILSDSRLKDILTQLKRRPLLIGEKKIRLSLAGAQNKLAVRWQDGKVALIKGIAPTTHIIKPLIEHISDSVHNEFFCMRLAQKVGITVPHTEIHFVDNIPCYIVDRYDREKTKGSKVIRVHQEDFCQALGILPEIKYEREGGPSIAKCQEIISVYSARPAIDQLRLLELIIFNYLIGNADAHGKNFSLIYRRSKPELAPAYDLLSTEVYPDLSGKMAMKIGGKYKPDQVFAHHWYHLVPDTKVAKNNLANLLRSFSQKTYECALILKDAFQNDGLQSPVINNIFRLIDHRAQKIQREF